jgi:flavodoxin I
MHRVGLFFASATGNSEIISRKIYAAFKPHQVDVYDVLQGEKQKLLEYDYLIFGIPSWNKHNIQNDWNDFLPKISDVNFSNKVVAIFGLGDQVKYSSNFVDGMGRIYNWLIEHHANVVGQWPTIGYNFQKSASIHKGKFVGLALDEDTQSSLTATRVKIWVETLKEEFDFTM